MARQYSSVAVQTTLASGIASSSSNTTGFAVTVSSVSGWPTSYPYTIIIDPDTASEEVCTVTAAVGTALTVTRGVDGTSAPAHSAAAVVKHGVSARDFSEPQVHIDNTTTAHGATGGVVGATNTQTLTNKTIAAGSNTITGLANANIVAGAAIDKTKISGTAITAADTGTVTSTMILDGTIVDADVNSAAAIAKTKISGTAVTLGDTGTVTSTMIADGTIVNADISGTAAIAAAKISGTAITAADNGTVTSTMIANNTIVDADINSAAAIAVTKLASSAVTIGGSTATLGGSNVTSLTGVTLDATSSIGGITGTTIAADHGAWQTFTPSLAGTGWVFTNFVAGTCKYIQIGKTVHFTIKLKATGSVTVGSGTLQVGLPVAAKVAGASYSAEVWPFVGEGFDGTVNFPVTGFIPVGTTTYFWPYVGGNTAMNSGSFASTLALNTWLAFSGTYEAA